MRANPVVTSRLRYDPIQDRLLGGDFCREFQGHWAKNTLVPLSRLETLISAMQAFGEAYATGVTPYPIPLAAIELNQFPATIYLEEKMVSIPELFRAEALSAAPPEYLRLGQLVSVVPSPETLDPSQPLTRPELSAFGRQLFALIRCAHVGMDATLSRRGGCCIHPDLLTPAGELNDLYFLSRAEELTPEVLRRNRLHDLAEALALLAALAPSTADLTAALEGAVKAYTADQGGKALDTQLKDAARDLAGKPYGAAEARKRSTVLAADFLATVM